MTSGSSLMSQLRFTCLTLLENGIGQISSDNSLISQFRLSCPTLLKNQYNDWPQEEDDELNVEPPFDESVLTPEQKVKLDELHIEHPTLVRSDLAILVRLNLLSLRAACDGKELTFFEEQEARPLEKVIYWVPPSELECTCVSTLEIHDVEDIHWNNTSSANHFEDESPLKRGYLLSLSLFTDCITSFSGFVEFLVGCRKP
ncbi:hypothetical protein ISN44_As13g004680 [Arabidopsis suecica]|uniref:Uncharacterized protein n=1 Tax=Arabidopsis suecica TaxID=45249 RepID=A0A8T1XZI4_ARASU|nr:hypothetical protein ISN44_As13g004680 [Arabidopsis suecica]